MHGVPLRMPSPIAQTHSVHGKQQWHKCFNQEPMLPNALNPIKEWGSSLGSPNGGRRRSRLSSLVTACLKYLRIPSPCLTNAGVHGKSQWHIGLNQEPISQNIHKAAASNAKRAPTDQATHVDYKIIPTDSAIDVNVFHNVIQRLLQKQMLVESTEPRYFHASTAAL